VESFDFLRHVTIGNYLPGDSLVHRLDPRAKITVVLLLIVVVTFSGSYTAHLVLLGVTIGLIALARLPLGYLFSGIKPALPFIVVLALMQLFFYGRGLSLGGRQGVIYWEWGWLSLTSSSLQLTVISIARFLELIFLAGILTNTTPLTSLAHGMEGMLRPFARLGVPAHELSLIGTIALRFVPVLAEQLETILKAQVSRGADLGLGGRLRFIQSARQVVVLLVPLFLNTLLRAEDLVLAMEARCYLGGKGRTHLVRLRLRGLDYAAMALSALFAAAMLAARSALV
jgi:energy-coupling factor transport system permease protein